LDRALRELADRAEDLGVARAIEVLGLQVLEALAGATSEISIAPSTASSASRSCGGSRPG